METKNKNKKPSRTEKISKNSPVRPSFFGNREENTKKADIPI